MESSKSSTNSETENPDLLEADADEHAAQALLLRAKAKRLRVANAALMSTTTDKETLQLTPEQYARRCQVSVATVHRWKADGMQGVVPIGKRYRVIAAEADAWRREHAARRPKRSREPDDSAVDVRATLESAGLRSAAGSR